LKKIAIVVSVPYQQDKLFDLSNKRLNRDNCLYPFFLLKVKLEAMGFRLFTHDKCSIEEAEIVIYINMSSVLPKKIDIDKSYLLLYESELIKPNNWDLENHKYFHKIFTWNDEFIDNKKYFKLNFSQNIVKKIDKDLTKKKQLCTLIAGNKKKKHPLELYSKRVEAIRFFEKKHPNEFEFYGIGWNEYNSSNRYIQYLLRKLKLHKIIAPKYPSWRGKIDSKKEILEKYKFAICYENAKDISGYITEKIFDCFFAGCVPVYWGANNIRKYIPENCFIDKNKFETYDELYAFLSNMSESIYLEYLDNIEKYLNSSDVDVFSNEFFVKQIVENIR